uniref:Protein FAM49B-like isoform X1 n=1 Tax=Crassostrea virginica TaxID=6565 RepID=A0A8B8CG58_CRAVI|nr:protein FAM49B-like isoform X1 [Crassostrea virginica]XP_022314790.1 protein FAM49B-like isoform X1 [Crassostrea virginica]XP_022314909.1 protein FAM49B-like isoform X1 [Crassostrea virginica]XP_022314911.1 protein FAM49B-like isoform X1 [Crassostrea virginica]
MGNLLKVLCQADSSASRDYDIFVDFESVQPTDEEKEVWEKVQAVLNESQTILQDIQQYTGATEDIKQAISNPTKDNLQEKAWLAVCPLVGRLKNYFEFANKLENTVHDLLEVLCSIDKTPREHLETQQACFKQFAQILDFVLRFDDTKMINPSIQNDFSYYRRTLSRMKMANECQVPLFQDLKPRDDNKGNENVVSNEMANRMSLFYAPATPMLKVLGEATTKFVSTHKELPVENTTDCLSTMANICRVMIETPEYVARFQNSETKLFCLRVMVGVIILYDHVHPVGAFAKSSNIDIKSCIKVLKEQEPGRVEGLLNALRYTTKTLNEETTPKAIKAMLAG